MPVKNMLDILNTNIINLIMDFANINEYWKRRFSCDVLPNINKYIILVSIIDDMPCARCYKRACNDRKLYGTCSSCEDLNSEKTTMDMQQFINSMLARRFILFHILKDYELTYNSLQKNSYRNNYKFCLDMEISMGGLNRKDYTEEKYNKLKSIMTFNNFEDIHVLDY